MEWIRIDLMPAKPAAKRLPADVLSAGLIVLLAAAAYLALHFALKQQQARNRWLQQALNQAERQYGEQTAAQQQYDLLRQRAAYLARQQTQAARTPQLLASLHPAPAGSRWQHISLNGSQGTLHLTLPSEAVSSWLAELNRHPVARFEWLADAPNGSRQLGFEWPEESGAAP